MHCYIFNYYKHHHYWQGRLHKLSKTSIKQWLESGICKQEVGQATSTSRVPSRSVMPTLIPQLWADKRRQTWVCPSSLSCWQLSKQHAGAAAEA